MVNHPPHIEELLLRITIIKCIELAVLEFWVKYEKAKIQEKFNKTKIQR